ncbi:hypothetical protein [Mycetocola saprophilus]|uniref:hypothetical protein n=1 Tax=Mycetocola saprophilus TaxID=76636 RepID=UPI0004BEEAB2|nr:hypothetical protein [Mycetocola saprophilus]
MSKISVDFEQMAEITKLMISASDETDTALARIPDGIDGGDFAQVMSMLVTLAAETSVQVSKTNRALAVTVRHVLTEFVANEELAVAEIESLNEAVQP